MSSSKSLLYFLNFCRRVAKAYWLQNISERNQINLNLLFKRHWENKLCAHCLHCILHLFCSTFMCILLKTNLRLQTQYTIRFIFRYLKNHVKLKIKQSLYNSLKWWWQSVQKQLGKIYGILSIKILRLTRALTLESFLRPSVSSQF